MDNRRILYVTMDSFYAAIEQRDNPDLRSKPVIVGSSDKRRGVVYSPSYEARKYGIGEAEATRSAKKKCSRLIIVPPRPKHYKQVAQQIIDILLKHSANIEKESTLKAYLEVTEPRMDITNAILIAKRIKEDIYKATNLSCSVGIANNKFLAKVAGEWNHPDGLTAIMPQKIQSFLDDVPVEKFIELGKGTGKKLNRLNLKKGSDIRATKKHDLIMQFGHNGLLFYDLVRGIDARPVNPNLENVPKNHSKSFTSLQEDIIDILPQFKKLVEKMDLESEITQPLKLHWRNKDFKITEVEVPISKEPTTHFEIMEKIQEQFESEYDKKGVNLIRIIY